MYYPLYVCYFLEDYVNIPCLSDNPLNSSEFRNKYNFIDDLENKLKIYVF